MLFRSVVGVRRQRRAGRIMTGMGDDGARGMKAMHDAARAPSRKTRKRASFGMPKEAIKLGVVDEVPPLEWVAGAIWQPDRAISAAPSNPDQL